MSRTCEVCGASLEGRRAQTRTCSERCRVERHRNRYRSVTDSGHTSVTVSGCEVCGAPRSPRSSTCSSRCRKRLHREGGSSWARRHARRWNLRPGDFWRTPAALFELLDAEFDFTLDAAASPDDAKCRTFFTPEDNALERSWAERALRPTGPGGHALPKNAGAVFCNPPYSVAGGGLARWVAKALEERARVDVVLVLPTTRTTGWARELLERADEIRYPLKRVAFVPPPGLEGSAPRHETMIPILRRGGQGPAREVSWDIEDELAQVERVRAVQTGGVWFGGAP